MTDPHKLVAQIISIERGRRMPPTLPPGGEPPYDDEMEKRVKALEDGMTQVRQDLAVIRSNYATKADIAEMKSAIIMWVVAAIFLAQLLPAVPAFLRAMSWMK